jgi:hypothetical protein
MFAYTRGLGRALWRQRLNRSATILTVRRVVVAAAAQMRDCKQQPRRPGDLGRVADRELGELPPEHYINQPALSPVIGEDPDGRDVKPGAGGSRLWVFHRAADPLSKRAVQLTYEWW